MNELVQSPAVQLPTDQAGMADYYRQYAEAYAASERRAGSTISARNGILSVGDQPIPGNQFAAVIIDAVRMNTFYPSAFDPSLIEPPRCYALGRNDAEMAPHPDMKKDMDFFKPQAERCAACPHNEFGSGRTGKGKACTNRRRLLMIHAGTYMQTPQGFVLDPVQSLEHYETSPFVTMALAPTTLAGYGAWIRETAANYQRPMFGVIARIFLYQHPKHGKEAIGFETLAPTPDAWAPIIMKRHQSAQTEIMEGFEAPQPQAQRGGGFHNAQEQAASLSGYIQA